MLLPNNAFTSLTLTLHYSEIYALTNGDWLFCRQSRLTLERLNTAKVAVPNCYKPAIPLSFAVALVTYRSNAVTKNKKIF